MSPRKPSPRSTAIPKKRPPRLKDIAAIAEVDISIVSRVLNDDPNLVVTPDTRSRILKAAAKLKYRPNAMARGLRQAQSMTLGLLVPEVANIVYFELIRGIEQEAYEAGYVLLLANAHEQKKVSEVYKRLVLERRVDGLLIASAADNENEAHEFDQEAMPIVWVNRKVSFGPSVIEDDEMGMALAVEHFAALGHKTIAHIAGPQDVDTGRRRLYGFRTAMEKLGLPVLPQHVVEAPFTEQGGYESMQTLLATTPTPTAVAISSFSATIGALAAVKQAGLQVPHDVSLVSFHDASIAPFLDPPLTTVYMPLRELGQLAVRQLLHLMAGENLPLTTSVTALPQLIKRGSTAPPPKRRRKS